MVLEETAGAKTLRLMEIQFNNQTREFMKLETGADKTVISESDYQPERDGQLKPSNRLVSGPTQEKLKECGWFCGCLTRNGIQHTSA